MAHFAHIDENNIVDQVLVVDQNYISEGHLGDPSKWIQTSYNTILGVHIDPDTRLPDGGIPLRKNYAGIGMIYDSIRDAFYCPQPDPSYIFNEETANWEPPKPEMPQDGKQYEWNKCLWVWSEIKIIPELERVQITEEIAQSRKNICLQCRRHRPDLFIQNQMTCTACDHNIEEIIRLDYRKCPQEKWT